MGMINLQNSLRYGPTGKKRKKHFTNAVKSKPTEFKKYTPPSSQLNTLREEQAKQYKSIMEEYMASGDYHTIASDTTKRESMKYTGTLVKGIATMHKSNAVPVISQEEAEDIAKMRRG